MKKTLLLGVVLLAFFLAAGMASAEGFGFGIVISPAAIGPPVISVSPPAYYPHPYGYYGPGYYGGYDGGYYGYRTQVHGYWNGAWPYYRWHHGWHPRYWRYRR